MRIFINQIKNKINIEFQNGDVTVYKCQLDKAEEFLMAVDRFIKKRKIGIESLQKASLRFAGTGVLTERIVRSIMAGLSFHPAGDPPKGDMLKFCPKF